MIRNFQNLGLERLFYQGNACDVNANHVRRLKVRLDALNVSSCLEDLDQPGFNFRPVQGKRSDEYSIHVNGNWCLAFRFEEGDCVDVDMRRLPS
jgi:proteic killer suppression protein